jgi:hypothetical protein
VTDLRIEIAAPTVGPDPDHEEIGLARAESTVETRLSPVPVDLVGSTITFDVPHELDVWVVCRVPNLGCARRSALAAIHLTDAQGHIVDSVGLKGAARMHVGFVTLDELIPAGSGTVTRKLRGQTSKGRGFANLGGAGRVTMDAYIR